MLPLFCGLLALMLHAPVPLFMELVLAPPHFLTGKILARGKMDAQLSALAKELGIQGSARLIKAAKARGITGPGLELPARAVIASSADKIFTAPVPSTGAVPTTVPRLAADGTIPADAAEETWPVDTAHLTAWSREFKYILVACDVFTRVTRAQPMKNLSQEEVLRAWKAMGPPFCRLCDIDGGWAFLPGTLLGKHWASEGIRHKAKSKNNVNSLALVDRRIQMIKSALVARMAREKTPMQVALPLGAASARAVVDGDL